MAFANVVYQQIRLCMHSSRQEISDFNMEAENHQKKKQKTNLWTKDNVYPCFITPQSLKHIKNRNITTHTGCFAWLWLITVSFYQTYISSTFHPKGIVLEKCCPATPESGGCCLQGWSSGLVVLHHQYRRNNINSDTTGMSAPSCPLPGGKITEDPN